MKKLLVMCWVVVGVGVCGHALAQTLEVKNAWARATVPGQNATGVFMQVTAPEDGWLVGATSPVAAVVEVHEMQMQDTVMRMRAVEGGLPLVAGKPLELKPGGYHVMLMDLRQTLPKGSTIALTLLFKTSKGSEQKIVIQVPVLQVAPKHVPAHGLHGVAH